MNRFINLKYLTFLVTIFSAIIPLGLYMAELSSQSLQVRLASQVSLQPVNSKSIQGLQVSIDGAVMKSPYLSVLELSNDGEKPILSSNFEAPLEIRIGEGSTLARAEVTATNPKDIEPTLASESQSLKIKPLLLNPKDVVTISVLTDGKQPEFTTKARIAGITEVPIDSSKIKTTQTSTVIILFFSSFLLFVAASLTDNAFSLRDSALLLSKRAGILVSAISSVAGAALLLFILEIVDLYSHLNYILCFLGMNFFSGVIASVLNRLPRPVSSNV